MGWDIENCQACPSVKERGVCVASASSETPHWVTLIAGHVQCDCKGFQYRGTCRHIKEAADKAFCGWAEQWGEEPANEERTCPKCGRDTIVIRIAV